VKKEQCPEEILAYLRRQKYGKNSSTAIELGEFITKMESKGDQLQPKRRPKNQLGNIDQVRLDLLHQENLRIFNSVQ
jgi:hypothetical protein